jgi:hypothetical protein
MGHEIRRRASDQPRDRQCLRVQLENRIVPWDKVEVVDTIPFLPNQCMIFVKTFNLLQSVRKMTQRGSSALRKSVTIVIEKDD